jgi:hypothetical protein
LLIVGKFNKSRPTRWHLRILTFFTNFFLHLRLGRKMRIADLLNYLLSKILSIYSSLGPRRHSKLIFKIHLNNICWLNYKTNIKALIHPSKPSKLIPSIPLLIFTYKKGININPITMDSIQRVG